MIIVMIIVVMMVMMTIGIIEFKLLLSRQARG